MCFYIPKYSTQDSNGSVQFWVALFVEASKQIEHVALRIVEENLSVWF